MAKRFTLRKGIYYWPTFTAARDWAASQGVTIGSSPVEWPRIVAYTAGFAIQLERSGNYLGSQHIKLTTTKEEKCSVSNVVSVVEP